MKTEHKQRVIVVFLLAFALWPLGHRWLVAKFETDPWLLHGWAMYCVPRLLPEIHLVAGESGRLMKVDPRANAEIDWNFRRYRHFRRMIGQLADPAPLLESTLRARPDIEEVRVVVITRRLDSSTGQLVASQKSFGLSRPSASATSP